MSESAMIEIQIGKRGGWAFILPMLLTLLLLTVIGAPLYGQESEADTSRTERVESGVESGAESGVESGGEAEAESSASSKESLFGFGGSASLSGDFYSYSGDTAGFTPRRPRSLIRLVVNTELRVGTFFSLPLNLMLSSEETNVVTPWTGEPSFGQYLQNQMNTIGIAPRFGWAQFFLGSHTPQNTGMAFDGSQLFGAGVSLQPGKFRLAASVGISQRAVEVDTVNGIQGSYRQRGMTARIGYGDEGGKDVAVALTVARVEDDTNSIRTVTETELISIPDSGSLSKVIPIVHRHSLMPAATDGTSSSLRLFVPVASNLSLQGEAAICNYTRDGSADELSDDVPVLSDVATQRISSRIDYALTASIGYSRPTFGIAAKGAYIGPGFITLGNPWAQADKGEFSLNPRFSAFGNRLNVSGAIGYRINNLSGTKTDRTTQVIGAATLQAQATEQLSFDLNYNNMGVSSNNRVDTFRLNNVAQSFSFSPTYIISGESATHAISGQVGVDTYADNNVIAAEENNTTTRTISGFYSLSLAGTPLTTTIGGSNTLQETSFGDLTINSVTLSVGYRLFNDALRPSLTASAIQSSTIESENDQRLSFRLGAEWRLSRAVSLNVSASTDVNSYGSSQSDRQVTEQFVQTSLTTRF